MGFVVNYPPVTKVTVDETTNEVVVAAAGPRGPQGEQGDPGAAASVAVGSTTTGAAGSDASVTNSGTSSAAVLDFTIPRGDTGEQGIQGEKGDQGDPGVVAATAPITYDSGTQTVALDESGIEIAPSQVTGTAVVDNDSRLSDARTPTAHATSHESGGSDAITLSASQVTGTAVVVADFVSALGESTDAIDTVPRYVATGAAPLSSGAVFWSFFTAQTAQTITEISMSSANSAAASLTVARMGLYKYDGTDLDMIARTANDTSLFSGTFTVYTRSFDTTSGYPASVTLVPGARYAAAVICVGSTMPSCYINGYATSTINSLPPRLTATLTAQSDLPTSTLSEPLTNLNRMYWMRLS